VRALVRDGFVASGTQRNHAFVSTFVDWGDTAPEEQLLLADAQTSGGLLVAGELPGHPVVGRLVEHRPGEPLIRVV
jgi:selenide,water dikinase